MYQELRNIIIEAATFDASAGNTKVTGMVFIDGCDEVGTAFFADYISYGPNNELYLAPGQSVAFALNVPEKLVSKLANVHIGIKSADGKVGKYTIKNLASAGIDDKVKQGEFYNTKSFTVNTTTDMYYDLGSWKNDVIVITNTGETTDGIISLTNIKYTFTDMEASGAKSIQPEENEVTAPQVYMTYNTAMLTLSAMNTPVEEAPEQIAPSIPDDEPETSEPEDDSETTAPETEPEEDAPSTGDTVVKTVIRIIKKLIGRIFG